jgi:hypothetical protein
MSEMTPIKKVILRERHLPCGGRWNGEIPRYSLVIAQSPNDQAFSYCTWSKIAGFSDL